MNRCGRPWRRHLCFSVRLRLLHSALNCDVFFAGDKRLDHLHDRGPQHVHASTDTLSAAFDVRRAEKEPCGEYDDLLHAYSFCQGRIARIICEVPRTAPVVIIANRVVVIAALVIVDPVKPNVALPAIRAARAGSTHARTAKITLPTTGVTTCTNVFTPSAAGIRSCSNRGMERPIIVQLTRARISPPVIHPRLNSAKWAVVRQMPQPMSTWPHMRAR